MNMVVFTSLFVRNGSKNRQTQLGHQSTHLNRAFMFGLGSLFVLSVSQAVVSRLLHLLSFWYSILFWGDETTHSLWFYVCYSNFPLGVLCYLLIYK